MSASASTAILLFMVAWGANHFVPLLLVYRARLGLSEVDLGILFGVYAVGLVPGLLVGGPLSDRVGRHRVAFPASLVALVGTTILSFGHGGFPVLLAGRFVVGLGSGATFSTGTAWLGDLARGRPPGTGARWATVALSGGFGGGPLVTGFIAQWAPSPMVTPYVLQGVLLALAIAVAFVRTDALALAPGRAAPHPHRGALPEGLLREIAPIGPWVFAFPSVSFAVFPLLLREQLGSFAVAYAGIVTGTTLLSGLVAQPLLRGWRRRSAAEIALVLGGGGLLIGLVAAGHESPVGVVAAALLLGAGYGGCLIAGLRTGEAMATAENRGRATGVFYVFAYLGFSAPLLLAAVAKHAGYSTGIVAMAVAAGLSAWFVRCAPTTQHDPGP